MRAIARTSMTASRRRLAARLLPPASAAALALLLAAAPASAQTTIDYDGTVDFTAYKTYSWGQNTSSGNPAADARIIEEIEMRLTAAGWKRANPGEGEVVVAEHATVKNDVSVDTFYTGWGTGWGWTGFGPGAGVGTTISQALRSGSLVVDMFDAGSKKLIWRGTAEGALSTKPEENVPKVQKIIARLFKKFPPAPPGAKPATTSPKEDPKKGDGKKDADMGSDPKDQGVPPAPPPR